MDETHECPVSECRARVQPDYVMCGYHWRTVPQELRSAVWRTWRGGLGWGSPEHIAAMRAAVGGASTRTAPAGG